MVKDSNEFTVKLFVTKENFISFLEKHGFKKIEPFSLDDYYYIPSHLDIDTSNMRDVLSQAIIYRNVNTSGEITKLITFKKKIYDKIGNILDQNDFSCQVYDESDAKAFIKAIGYKEILNIKESSVVYRNSDLQFALKEVDKTDLLLEFELEKNSIYSSMDDLKEKILDYKFPIDESDFFVKKVEICLNRLLNK